LCVYVFFMFIVCVRNADIEVTRIHMAGTKWNIFACTIYIGLLFCVLHYILAST